MFDSDLFLSAAQTRGFNFYTCVPCSFLTPLINRVISDRATAYVGAASEGEAVGIAAGAWLAGRQTVAMCQNSGLGNMVNPLTSLNHPFRIPSLLIVTWRGQPGHKDEPQHEFMGRATSALLDVIGVPHRLFPRSEHDIDAALEEAIESMAATGLPFALVMEKDSMQDDGLDQPPPSLRPNGQRQDHVSGEQRPRRISVLERVLAAVPESAAIIATTGKCGRELFTLADRPQHLYQVGSMGCASAIGLGVAINYAPPVVVLDGDGAALMKMGSLATIGAYAPDNLIHVVLDNGIHDSTGGQATVSATVDFADVALACGYSTGAVCDEVSGFDSSLSAALKAPGPHLIHMRIAPGALAQLGRPTVTPQDVAQRFKSFLASA